MLTIGRLAAVAGVTADRIRFYERQGLISAVRKNESGYRLYDEAAVRRLTFIRQAQQCGFSLAEIRELLELKLSGEVGSEEVYRRILEKKLQIEHQARTLHAMAEALGNVLSRQ